MIGFLTAVVQSAALSASISASVVSGDVRLTGAGATFPEPLYQRWVADYEKINPTVKIEYGGGGSGAGIKAVTDKTVAFGATDAPMSAKELEAAGGADKIVEFPTCAGAVVPAYNLPGVKDLKFTGELLADIFMGKVTKWNDGSIASLNPDVKLPDVAITPAWRTDGSGTTFVFTSYLATQSNTFKTTIGMAKQVKWPVGQGGKGNPGVAAVVQQTAGAIGYIELNYADANHIDYGSVKNQAGKFVKASAESVSAAGEAAAGSLKGNQLTANIWNQPGEKCYPISAFTYIILYKDLSNLNNKEEADALMGFLNWAVLGNGQKTASEMTYAPLTKTVQAKIDELIKGVKYAGTKK